MKIIQNSLNWKIGKWNKEKKEKGRLKTEQKQIYEGRNDDNSTTNTTINPLRAGREQISHRVNQKVVPKSGQVKEA